MKHRRDAECFTVEWVEMKLSLYSHITCYSNVKLEACDDIARLQRDRASCDLPIVSIFAGIFLGHTVLWFYLFFIPPFEVSKSK